jgi:hypothetical protein
VHASKPAAADGDGAEQSAFSLHWSPVPPALAGGDAGTALLAVWPAPVNPDACFEAAGFADFGDADDAWDRRAAGLLVRLIAELGAYGEPRLLGAPLRTRPGLARRLMGGAGETLPLEEQIQAPMHHDSLPDTVVAFGAGGVALRAGGGHVLYWITLPEGETDRFVAGVLPRLADGSPLHETPLEWRHLLPRTRVHPGSGRNV